MSPPKQPCLPFLEYCVIRFFKRRRSPKTRSGKFNGMQRKSYFFLWKLPKNQYGKYTNMDLSQKFPVSSPIRSWFMAGHNFAGHSSGPRGVIGFEVLVLAFGCYIIYTGNCFGWCYEILLWSYGCSIKYCATSWGMTRFEDFMLLCNVSIRHTCDKCWERRQQLPCPAFCLP